MKKVRRPTRSQFSVAVDRLRACLQAVACRALRETKYHT